GSSGGVLCSSAAGGLVSWGVSAMHSFRAAAVLRLRHGTARAAINRQLSDLVLPQVTTWELTCQVELL
ncbi:UNVERIFIED_CONTAM: hypothetical protein RF649_14960, partial [Kocuria sp. CPCC 205295]|uniref:hypothetical protein n=1 Tax=Kocuria sp. CPCC 205295 TaxID=3073557 RepID=UPI0036DBF2F4